MDKIKQSDMNNAVKFAKELVELENKYHVKLEFYAYEDWDYSYDDESYLNGVECRADIVNNDGYAIADLRTLLNDLDEGRHGG